jgi:hypothetical protein
MQHGDDAKDGTTRPKMCYGSTQTTPNNDPGVAGTRRGPVFS